MTAKPGGVGVLLFCLALSLSLSRHSFLSSDCSVLPPQDALSRGSRWSGACSFSHPSTRCHPEPHPFHQHQPFLRIPPSRLGEWSWPSTKPTRSPLAEHPCSRDGDRDCAAAGCGDSPDEASYPGWPTGVKRRSLSVSCTSSTATPLRPVRDGPLPRPYWSGDGDASSMVGEQEKTRIWCMPRLSVPLAPPFQMAAWQFWHGCSHPGGTHAHFTSRDCAQDLLLLDVPREIAAFRPWEIQDWISSPMCRATNITCICIIQGGCQPARSLHHWVASDLSPKSTYTRLSTPQHLTVSPTHKLVG